ncbi:MAG: 50S ribosomal protein L11 methyltransferase [SAR324 cluster bacterium]|nr:50S ribosomal protein L11 methyltransferase [SAR324 cluster bacterium]
MKTDFYLELLVELPQRHEDLWSTFCFEESASGIEIAEETNSILQMRVFFEDKPVETIRAIPEKFCRFYQYPFDAIKILSLNRLPYQDWQAAWKQYFVPTQVGKSFTICPPWKIEGQSSGRIPIVIDPGQGFGTGQHPSTVLALETLEKHIFNSATPPGSLLDVGIGSGILAFAAAYLGVPLVHGIDLEKEAVQDVIKNRNLNQLNEIVQAFVGKPDCLTRKYSIVISNMLFHELLSVKSDFARLVAPSGVLICSGFLAHQWVELETEFLKLGLAPLHTYKKDDWRSVILSHCFQP